MVHLPLLFLPLSSTELLACVHARYKQGLVSAAIVCQYTNGCHFSQYTQPVVDTQQQRLSVISD